MMLGDKPQTRNQSSWLVAPPHLSLKLGSVAKKKLELFPKVERGNYYSKLWGMISRRVCLWSIERFLPETSKLDVSPKLVR